VGEDAPRQIASGLRAFYESEADITGNAREYPISTDLSRGGS
jgi:hypothetical protein